MHVLYISSHIISISVLYAYYHSLADMTALTSCVMATSLWYWKDPQDGTWAQWTDRVMVRVSFLYILYEANRLDAIVPVYYLSIGSGIVFYGAAKYISHKNKELSHYLHCVFHVCGTVSNCVIFPSIATRRISC